MRSALSCARTCRRTSPRRCRTTGGSRRTTWSAGRRSSTRRAGSPATGRGIRRPGLDAGADATSSTRSASPPAARRSIPFGLSMVAPVIMAFGTPWQKKHYLPRILSAAKSSGARATRSPAPGSDLASLKTRAVREDDHFVVNGQKTWTTLGAVRRHDLLPRAHRPDGEEAGRHQLPADRHAVAGHHGAADHHASTASTR